MENSMKYTSLCKELYGKLLEHSDLVERYNIVEYNNLAQEFFKKLIAILKKRMNEYANLFDMEVAKLSQLIFMLKLYDSSIDIPSMNIDEELLTSLVNGVINSNIIKQKEKEMFVTKLNDLYNSIHKLYDEYCDIDLVIALYSNMFNVDFFNVALFNFTPAFLSYMQIDSRDPSVESIPDEMFYLREYIAMVKNLCKGLTQSQYNKLEEIKTWPEVKSLVEEYMIKKIELDLANNRIITGSKTRA